jgi:xenotropic and polytropic retrovirus receptor 1
MKFSTLLKSNKLQGWEEYYIQYNNLVKYLKSDINRFKSLLTSEYTKITNFFNEIEQQTDEQRKVLLTILSGNLNDETPYKTNKKERFKHLDLIERIKKMRDNHEANGKSVSTEDFLTEFSDLDSQISDIEKNKKVAITESDVSMGGEESDFENIKIINKVDEEIKNIKDHKKRRMFNFDHFKINTPFEKRKKEKAFHELLQAINSVKSFRDINYMGLSIVIRKYKNNKGNDEFSSAFLKKLHQSHFGKSKKIDKMQKEVRYIYKKVFVLDDKLQAQIIFKRIGKKVKPDPWLTFLVGVLGSLLGIIIFNTDFEQNSSVKRVIFSIGLIQFGAFLFGLCNLVFIKYDINYNLIFNFDVISTLSPVEFIFYISVSMNFTFLACFFLIKSHPQLLMYSVVGLNIVIIILPFDILWLNSRLYFISVFLGTLASGFRKVYFKNFFLQMCFKALLLASRCYYLNLV